MQRSPRQRILYVLAILFAVAPIALGLIRALRTHHDFRMLWMALIAFVATAAVMVVGGARRRSTRGLLELAFVALIVAVLLAGLTAMRLGATAAAGIWPVAFVLSACCVASYVSGALSRTTGEPPRPAG